MDAQGVAAQAAGGADALSSADEQALVEALARSAVQDAAPEELPLFAPTSEAYFDPRRGTPAGAKSDEMLGFGVDAAAAMVFVTPVALEAARSVVSYLVTELQAAAKDESKPMIQALVHRLAHLRDKPGATADAKPADAKPAATKPAEPEPAAFTEEQLQEVHKVALRTAERMGMEHAKAAVVADAIVGAVAV
jgi:hypothetical protein